MNDNNKEQQSLQLELPQDVAQGEYANFAIITHSSSDFIIDFARVLPGVPKAQVKSRVILAPEHAKRLLAALQENIMRYENEFGPIRIPNQQAAPIAPFDLTKGEARCSVGYDTRYLSYVAPSRVGNGALPLSRRLPPWGEQVESPFL